MRPADRVACPPFSATLSASSCATRHAARTASGSGRGFPIHEVCAACPLGRVRLNFLLREGWEPRKYQPFNIHRDAVQRAARERLRRSGALEPVPTLDTPTQR